MRTRWLVAALASVIALAACEDDERPPAARGASTIGTGSSRRAPAGIDAQRAIAAATSAVPGSAQEARLESHGGKRQYEVTVLPKGGGSPVRVEVDATSGQVLKSGPRGGRDDDDD